MLGGGKQMAGPEISVLMGAYYRRPDTALLERSVQSILGQSAADFEFLICDDGSAENAKQFLEWMAQEDSRIRLLRVDSLFTLSKKLNVCLRQAKGKLIARMDDDDFSYPDRFAKQAAALEAHSDIAFVGSNVELYRGGKSVGTRMLPEKPCVKDFFFTQPYIHPALMFRRDALLSVDGYSESPHCLLCEDYDLLLRLYAKGYQGMNLQENLLAYTLPDTAKGTRKMRHRWNETVTRFYRYKELKVLPWAFPYVIKPLAVGLLPEPVLRKLKGMSP